LANHFAVGDQTEFSPKLTIFVENGLPIDASLEPDTRRHLQNLVLQQGGTVPSLLEDIDGPPAQESISQNGLDIQQIEVPLKFDSQFFKSIQHKVSVLEALQSGEQSALTNQIVALSKEVTTLSKPSRLSKSDMNRWRELFAIYLEANIFFSTHELDHGRRDGATATKQVCQCSSIHEEIYYSGSMCLLFFRPQYPYNLTLSHML
jgi:E3 ubiquitin-protein ligase BAH